jgi:hypothetical protein
MTDFHSFNFFPSSFFLLVLASMVYVVLRPHLLTFLCLTHASQDDAVNYLTVTGWALCLTPVVVFFVLMAMGFPVMALLRGQPVPGGSFGMGV